MPASREGIREICTRRNARLGKHEAQRLGLDDQGKRKLAYEIRKFQKGHYLCLSYLDTGKVVPELERTLRLEESILRFLTVQVNPEVKDIEARKAEAAEAERIREQKAAERAAREAEEATARAEAEAQAAVTAAAEAKAAAAAEAAPESQDDAEPAEVVKENAESDDEAASDEGADEEDKS